AGLPLYQHSLRLAPSRLLKAAHELAEGRGPSHQWGHQLAWRPALHRGGTDRGARGTAWVASLGGANVLGQSNGLRGRLGLQRLGQPRPAGSVDLQSSTRLASRQVQAHEATIGLLRERIECQPAGEGGAGLLLLSGGLLPARESIEEHLQANL